MSSDRNDPKPERLDQLHARETSARNRRPRAPSPERSYPKMRQLLAEPDSVPYGLEATPSATVPSTFIRRAPEKSSTGGADLDSMLEDMADGLLIGESAEGGREMRISLRDEFFRGTELRIVFVAGSVSAELRPPDMETYRILMGRASELEERLLGRGLKVRGVTVFEP